MLKILASAILSVAVCALVVLTYAYVAGDHVDRTDMHATLASLTGQTNPTPAQTQAPLPTSLEKPQDSRQPASRTSADLAASAEQGASHAH